MASLEKEATADADVDAAPLPGFGAEDATRFGHIDEKALMRKVDLHLIPLFSVLFLLSYLDRGNIGNAKIEGLAEDLHLTGKQYDMCLTVFFILYASMEVPSNMILKRTNPRVFIPMAVVLFAVVMVCMGTVTNYAQLVATRALLGTFEAALFPGISYFLSMYYKKSELLTRQAIFVSSASMAGAFSGLLAAAISKMHGVGGYEGWRWIFILEGLLTLVAGLVAFWLCPAFPASAAFLTQDEQEYVQHRVQYSSNGTSPYPRAPLGEDNSNDRKYLWDTLKSWSCWCQVLCYMGVVLPVYATSLFTPTIIKELGYSATRAQLMSVPIYVLASACAMFQGFVSDRVGLRSPFLVLNFTCMAVGYIVCLTGDPVNNGKGVYAGIYIAAVGMYPALPISIVWNANNLSGSYKRALGIALQIGVANYSGAFASNFYRTQDKPYFRFGHGLVLMFIGIGAIALVLLIVGYTWANKKKRAAIASGKYDDYTDEELLKMGDKSPYFIYRL